MNSGHSKAADPFHCSATACLHPGRPQQPQPTGTSQDARQAYLETQCPEQGSSQSERPGERQRASERASSETAPSINPTSDKNHSSSLVTQYRPSRSRPPPNPPAVNQPASQPASPGHSSCHRHSHNHPTPYTTQNSSPSLPPPPPLSRPSPSPSPFLPLPLPPPRLSTPPRHSPLHPPTIPFPPPHDTDDPRQGITASTACNPLSQTTVAPFNRPIVVPSPVTSYGPSSSLGGVRLQNPTTRSTDRKRPWVPAEPRASVVELVLALFLRSGALVPSLKPHAASAALEL